MSIATNISEMGFRTANKVGLQLRCASTACDAGSARRLIDDSMLLTLQLLDRLDPVVFRNGYQFQFDTFQKSLASSEFSADVWRTIQVNKCESLRNNGIQEKLIAELGTEMGAWKFDCVSFERLGQSMNQLACLSTVDSDRVYKYVLKQDVFNTKTEQNYATGFSNAVGGVSLLIEANATVVSPKELLTTAAISCFAATLVVENVKLFD